MSKRAKPLAERKIDVMHAAYGVREGKRCGGCAHFGQVHYHEYGYPKCDLTRWTHGPGSDWSSRFEACGRYIEREEP